MIYSCYNRESSHVKTNYSAKNHIAYIALKIYQKKVNKFKFTLKKSFSMFKLCIYLYF